MRSHPAVLQALRALLTRVQAPMAFPGKDRMAHPLHPRDLGLTAVLSFTNLVLLLFYQLSALHRQLAQRLAEKASTVHNPVQYSAHLELLSMSS